jgi:hypothetical protein
MRSRTRTVAKSKRKADTYLDVQLAADALALHCYGSSADSERDMVDVAVNLAPIGSTEAEISPWMVTEIGGGVVGGRTVRVTE